MKLASLRSRGLAARSKTLGHGRIFTAMLGGKRQMTIR